MPLDQPLPTFPTEPGAPNGEAAAAQEARRMERLAVLARLRARAERISEKLCDLIEDKLPPDEREPFARIADPVLAFTRAATAIRRIVALEGQIDEAAEERAARLAKEAAARVKEEAEAARVPPDGRIHLRACRRIARQSIRDAIKLRDEKMDAWGREALLDDLTADLDDADYADVDLIMAQIGKELDAIVGAPAHADGGTAEHADDENPPPPLPAQDVALSRAAAAADLHAAITKVSAAIERARARGSG